VPLSTMRTYVGQGHFASGSMGPKVDALCRFVDRTGGTAVITDLAHIVPAIRGQAGTVVVPDPQDNREEAP
jgi:carbamate kinase